MSHNTYPYRRSTKDPETYNASGDLRPGEYDVYRTSQEPSHSTMPSYPSSSRGSVKSYSAQRSDRAMTVLNSCGLEPNDLALLAEMPEDLITMDNLPHLLMQIRNKRGTQSYSVTSHPNTSHPRPPATNPQSRTLEQSGCHLVEYSLDPSLRSPQPLPPKQVHSWQDRWGNPRQTGKIMYTPPSAPSSYIVDYNYGNTGSVNSNYERPAYSVPSGESSRKPPPISSQPAADYRYPSTADFKRPERLDQDALLKINTSTLHKTPSRKAAYDFHGEIPQTYPYSCSLCDITVLSEKYWTVHINGAQHADGQLTLLQLYPDWDCRMDTTRKPDDRSKVEEKPARLSKRPTEYSGQTSNSRREGKEKVQERKGSGKVVCAKFAAQSVTEDYLKDLIKPFGEVVKIIMFPALAFVEMGSTNQAEDLVASCFKNPGRQVSFSVSSTFNFLQSSRVVGFSPVPSGTEWDSELIAIAKRFGPVQYSLFLPTRAYVEMTYAQDAQKLVEHHSAKALKIDGIAVKVTFSSEYNTLKNVTTDRKSEDRSVTKRKRTPSPRRRTHSPRRDSPHLKSRSREDSGHRREGDKSKSPGKNRSRSLSKHSDSTDRSARSPRSHIRESVSNEKSTGPAKTESKQNKADPFTSSQAPQTKEALSATVKEPKDTDNANRHDKIMPQESREEEATETCDMDSDIEGMEVIGEDGEKLEDESVESLVDIEAELLEEVTEENALDDAMDGRPSEAVEAVEKEEEEEEEEEEKKREDKKEEMTEVTEQPAQNPTSPTETANPPMELSAAQEQEEEGDAEDQNASVPDDDEEEPDFPESLDKCITLDELDEELSDDQDEKSTNVSETSSGRVIYITMLPKGFYTDSKFLRLFKGFGKVSRYFLIRSRREGFIEMSKSADALKAVKELKDVIFNDRKLFVQLSRKYQTLTTGWVPESDSDSNSERRKERKRRSSSRRSERNSRSHSKSKTTEREDSPKKTSVKDEKTAQSEECQQTDVPSMDEKEDNDKADVTGDKPSNNLHSQISDAKIDASCDGPKDVRADEEEKQACTSEDKVVTRLEKKAEPRPENVETVTPCMESYQPNNPVGREFIRPVVGYFCNLCKVIYAEEEEAKNQHCSSLSHYQKFMEHSGKDAASS